jgi:hypothetical protein
VGIFGSSRSFIGSSSFFFVSGMDICGLLGPFGDFPSAINNVRPALEGAAAAARHRHGLEVEDEGHLKDFDVISVLLRCSILFAISFNVKVLFAKKRIWIFSNDRCIIYMV